MDLIEAAKNGNFDRVKQLIREGVDINQVDSEGNTALIWSVRNGFLYLVKYLIEAGANANLTNNRGITALMYATVDENMYNSMNLYNRLALVKELIKGGANVNASDDLGTTPLYYAIMSGSVDIIKELIRVGADYTIYKDIPDIRNIINDIIKDERNDLKKELTNNYLSLSKGTPQTKVGDKVKSAIPKSLLLRSVYEVPYQTLCSKIDRNYPPLRLIALANILKVDYNIDISWVDLCSKINKTLYLML